MSLGKEFAKAKKASPQAQPAIMDLFFILETMKSGETSGISADPIIVPDIETLRVLPDWGPPAGSDIAPSARLPGPPHAARESVPVGDETWNDFLDHLVEREGYRNEVYRDSLGKPTVGVGHLVRPEDNLQVGDRISDEQVRAFLERDASAAYRAAIEQANELGINDSRFVIALGSVNFQLGTGWREKFPQTWAHMENGNYEQAIRNIEGSLWARQTPVRTRDFVSAIRDATGGQTGPAAIAAASISPAFANRAGGAAADISATTNPAATAPPRMDIA